MSIVPDKLFDVAELPISHPILSTSLAQFSRVNDKISYMLEKGELIKVQRGLYVFNNTVEKNPYLKFNIANTLYGPSYVSRFSALSFYGLLAEQTVTAESMALSRVREYETPFGNFEYYKSNINTFPIGIQTHTLNSFSSFLMASPEKALCDLIWIEKTLPIKSLDDMMFFLSEDLRLDLDFFKDANFDILKECHEKGNKKKELGFLLKLLKK